MGDHIIRRGVAERPTAKLTEEELGRLVRAPDTELDGQVDAVDAAPATARMATPTRFAHTVRRDPGDDPLATPIPRHDISTITMPRIVQPAPSSAELPRPPQPSMLASGTERTRELPARLAAMPQPTRWAPAPGPALRVEPAPRRRQRMASLDRPVAPAVAPSVLSPAPSVAAAEPELLIPGPSVPKRPPAPYAGRAHVVVPLVMLLVALAAVTLWRAL